MSNEREIQAAEKQLHETGADLDAAQRAYRSAEGRLRGAMRMWLKRITGPIEPVGSRTMRRSVPLADVPGYIGDNDSSWAPRGLVGDRMYATNGHVMIDVESVEGLTMIDAHPRDIIGSRAERLTRADTPIEYSETLTIRSFGSGEGRILANARYTTIVEDIFPGVEWHAAHLLTGGMRHLHAVTDGHLVAVVLPLRSDILIAAQQV